MIQKLSFAIIEEELEFGDAQKLVALGKRKIYLFGGKGKRFSRIYFREKDERITTRKESFLGF